MGDEIEPAHVYAATKLGYIVTEANASLFTDEEMQAWDDAVAEFEECHGAE